VRQEEGKGGGEVNEGSNVVRGEEGTEKGERREADGQWLRVGRGKKGNPWPFISLRQK